MQKVYPFIVSTIKHYYFMNSLPTVTRLAVKCCWNIISFHSSYKHYFSINLKYSKHAIWETFITFNEFWITIITKQYFKSNNTLKSSILHIFYFLKTKANHNINHLVNLLYIVLVPCVTSIKHNIFSSVLLGKLNQGFE